MTQEQNKMLQNAVNDLFNSQEIQKLRKLVIDLSLSEDCHKGSYMNVDPSVERNIDGLAEFCGWIHDTLNGEPKRGLSKKQKIRKALGYTYP